MSLNVIDISRPFVDIPELADWVSSAARAHFEELKRLAPPPSGDVEAQRAHYDAINRARLERALERYPVNVDTTTIAGVVVHEITPPTSSKGTLICLHGGAFIWGAGAGAILEAVPVASTAGMRVLAVEYRLAPEHRYPAAVEDALAVLAEVRSQSSDKVGMYGCSAGAVLTAQVVARLIAEGKPPPQAIAMLHGSGVEVGGDSLGMAGQLNGMPPGSGIQRMHDLSYFDGSDPADHMVFPGAHPELLASFPPSLLITGTRDFAASGVTVMQRRLAAQGVDAQLVLFDGLWHAHHVDVDLPEAQETYALMAAFFRCHLGDG